MNLNYQRLGVPELPKGTGYTGRDVVCIGHGYEVLDRLAALCIDHGYEVLDRLAALIASTDLGMDLDEVETSDSTRGKLVLAGNAIYERQYDGEPLTSEIPIEVVIDGNTASIRTQDNGKPSKKLVEGLAELAGQNGDAITSNGGYYELELILGNGTDYRLTKPPERESLRDEVIC